MPVQFSSKEAAGKLFPMLKVWGDRPGHPAVALNRPICLIGRRGMHLSLESQTVSRTHALIINDSRRVYIRDLASRNGTIVNGHPIHETELAEAAIVRVGSYTLRCETGFPRSPDEISLPPAPAIELHVDGHTVPIPAGQKTVLIGRRDGCEIQLVDDDASPVHAVIFQLGGKHIVRDLNSENGTFINGQPARQAELQDGAEIRIGRTKIRYAIAAPATDDDVADGEPFDDIEAVLEQAVGQELSPRRDDAFEDMLEGELSAQPSGDGTGVDAEEDVDAELNIEVEQDDSDPDFGSTALESNYEQLAATPLPSRLMGDLEEPQAPEAAPAGKVSPEHAEPAPRGTQQQPSAPAATGQHHLLATGPKPEPAAPAPAPPQAKLAEAELIPLEAEKAGPETSVLLTGAAPDRLADAPAAVAVEAAGVAEKVDASSGPIALNDDEEDDLVEMHERDKSAASPSGEDDGHSPASAKGGEVLEAPGEVVDGKVVSPAPFADRPLRVEPRDAQSRPPDVATSAPGAAQPGVFAKADLITPQRPPGLTSGAAALPAPPTSAAAMPAPQPKLQLMDDAVLAEVVNRGAPARDMRRPARRRVRQLSRRVKDLTSRVAALEAELSRSRGEAPVDRPVPGADSPAANGSVAAGQPGRDR